jgi:predicted nucleic acid-binding protein
VTACVVDANIAAKWLLPAAGEGLLEQANHLLALHVRHDLQLLAPDLIEAEIGNVLWKAVRRSRISEVEAEKSLGRFAALQIQVVRNSDLLHKALRIAVVCDCSFYDSLYVALALTTRTQLVTADERLVNALASRFPVRWLGALYE